jgi:hypothetical protein
MRILSIVMTCWLRRGGRPAGLEMGSGPGRLGLGVGRLVSSQGRLVAMAGAGLSLAAFQVLAQGGGKARLLLVIGG